MYASAQYPRKCIVTPRETVIKGRTRERFALGFSGTVIFLQSLYYARKRDIIIIYRVTCLCAHSVYTALACCVRLCARKTEDVC